MCSRLPWEAILRYIDKKAGGRVDRRGPAPVGATPHGIRRMISFKSLSAKGAEARAAKVQYKNHPYKLPPHFNIFQESLTEKC